MPSARGPPVVAIAVVGMDVVSLDWTAAQSFVDQTGLKGLVQSMIVIFEWFLLLYLWYKWG